MALRLEKEIIQNNTLDSKKTDKEIAREKALEEREIWHKLIVKIITWKDGNAGKGMVGALDKVSPKEWKIYKKRLIEASPAKNLEKIDARIKRIFGKIKKNGGFA